MDYYLIIFVIAGIIIGIIFSEVFYFIRQKNDDIYVCPACKLRVYVPKKFTHSYRHSCLKDINYIITEIRMEKPE